MENFLTVAQQVAILFVLIGTGAVLRKLKVIPEHAIEGLVNLLILVVTPCRSSTSSSVRTIRRC